MSTSRAATLVVSLAIVACETGGGGDESFGAEGPFTTGTMATTGGGPGNDADTDEMEEGTSDPAEGSGTTSGGDTDEPMPGEDQALGTIVIGETHPVGTGDALAILSASFVPDASVTPQSCAMEVDGCQVSPPLDCAPTVCGADQVCAYDENCTPTCQIACTLACAADEVCYFPFPDTPACRKVETFDAGRLDFVGTLSPITLYPPYTIPAGVPGPLSLPDRELTVTASGATQAGFAGFEAKTTSMESVFSTIDTILPAEAFGAGDLQLDWIAGADEMTVTVTVTGMLGLSGTVTCEADDAAGTFAVPRTALTAAIPADTPTSFSLALQRRHTETTMGIDTVGTLLDHLVPPTGFIDFTYTSIETGTLTNM